MTTFRRVRFAALTGALLVTTVGVWAALLGVTPGLPTTTFSNPGTTSYTASTHLFSVTSTPSFETFATPIGTKMIIAPRGLTINIQVANNGTLIGGVAGNDLTLTGSIDTNGDAVPDYSGVLLTGEILAFGYQNVSTTDVYDFRFQVTGGALAPLYGSNDIGVRLTSENSTFGGSFAVSFRGMAKGTLGPIPPLPATGRIGDFVWNDTNSNGIQEAGESGIPNVSVTLWDATHTTVLGSTTTDANGGYLFSGLSAGTYIVDVLPPAGYLASPTLQGGDPTKDSNPNGFSVTLPTNSSSDLTIDFGYYAQQVGIKLIKFTNGQDADLPTGPVVPVGSAVAWTYDVTNTSNVPLTNVTVVDDNGTPGNTADDFPATCPKTTLAPAETMTCTATGTALPGQYANIATATGTPPSGPPVTDTNPSHYFGATASIKLVKFTNGQDADLPTGPIILVGQPVNWTYDVTNTGNVDLTNVTVMDDAGTPLDPSDDFPATCPKTTLLVGESMTCTATGTAKAGQYENIAIATGKPPAGPDVTSTNPSHYFGEVPSGTIGDFVWSDTNANGIQEPGELGIPNVSVTLWDATHTTVLGSTTTDANGLYLFGGLLAGTYVVDVLPPPGYLASPTLQGGDTTKDSNPNPFSVTLPTNSSSDLTVDFGYFPQHVGITLIKFTNGDDADLPTGPVVPIGSTVTWTYNVTNTSNVTLNNVKVVDDNGTPGDTSDDFPATCPKTTLAPAESMTCSATGIALPGQYANVATATGEPPFGPPPTDTNPSHYFGASAAIQLIKFTNGQDADTPTGPTILVGDPVNWTYNVTNTGNVDLTNVTVMDDAGTPLDPSDDFPATCPKTTLLVGESMTCTATGTAKAGQYENFATATGTPPIGPDVTSTNPSHYFGEVPSGTIGDFVWSDTNADGIQDAGELGIPNVSVTLWDATHTTVLGSTTTDANGLYLFGGLLAGTYIVEVSPPPGYLASPTLQGSDTALDSNPNPFTVTLPTNSSSDLTVDFGYFPQHLGITLIKFTNGDDADLPTGPVVPIGSTVTWTYNVTNTSNVTLNNVTVVDDNGTPGNTGDDFPATCPKTTLAPAESMTCSATGIALPGQYANVATASGEPPFGPPPTDTNPSHYFGANASIKLVKFTNGQDADTPPGPTILFGQPVNWTYDVTNTGNVELTNVKVVDDNGTPSDPSDDFPATCPQTTLAVGESMTCTATGTAKAGQYENFATATGTPPVGPDVTSTNPSHYFGEVPSGTIGDFVWNDTNANGIQDAGEPGIPGVTVQLWDATHTTMITSMPTDANGGYLFTGLLAGTYIVEVIPPPGYLASPTLQGSDTALDSNPNPFTVTLPTNSSSDLTIDFGYWQPASLGDFVWNDLNHNGIQDSGEPGIPGVTVQLWDATHTTMITSMPTDANGGYLFTGLAPGTYQVDVVAPAGMVATLTGQGTPATDSNTLPATVTIGPGGSDLTIDFGYWQPASLGDFVWNDLNHDGIQDSGEPGISGVTVELWDATHTTMITSMPTDANGLYGFSNLIPGSYQVEVDPTTVPAGMVATITGQGTTATDSNVQPALVTLIAGQNDPTIDFGYWTPPLTVCVPLEVLDTLPTGGTTSLSSNLLFFADGSVDANWQGATKGFVGDVTVNGLLASERTSGGVPYAGTLYTNAPTQGAWQAILDQNLTQATGVTNATTRVDDYTLALDNAFSQINAMTPTPGFVSVAASALDGLNTQNGTCETFVINVTSGFSGISQQINITGDACDYYILRWDTDADPANGYQGQVKFQSGGAIVPHGGLTPGNFISVAGDIGSSGGGSTPPPPYPQGPRFDNGLGALIIDGADFSGGGFFTGYWLTTGDPVSGQTSSLSNAIFVGGWYSTTNQFSMTSGTSGVYVAPNCPPTP